MNPAFEKPSNAPQAMQPGLVPGNLQETYAVPQSPPSYVTSPTVMQSGGFATPTAHSEHMAQTQYMQPQHTMQQPQQMQYRQQQPQQPVQQPKQQVNVQVQPQNSQYRQAVPIPALGMSAAPVDCPSCGQRRMTAISYHAGNTTHLWAGVACLVTCLFCFVPYLMNSMKDVQHRCSGCGRLLATWHKSGNVEVHCHA